MTGRMTLCSPDWHSKWKTLSGSFKVSEIDSKRHPQKEKGKKEREKKLKKEREKKKKEKKREKSERQLKYFPRQRKLSLCVCWSLKSSKIVTPKSSQHTALDLVSMNIIFFVWSYIVAATLTLNVAIHPFSGLENIVRTKKSRHMDLRTHCQRTR